MAVRHIQDADSRQIVLLGPRQVGKTTALQQIARHLLRSAPPQAVCYLRLDDPDLEGLRLGEVVDLYRRERWSPARLAYLLLDEVHASSGWARQLKSWVDDRAPLRVAATGSLAATVAEGSRESGPGRWDELPMPPLDLFEYALLRGRAREGDAPGRQGDWWQGPAETGPPDLEDIWRGFLLQGGFPAAALMPDLVDAHARLREDIYERVLIRDMAVHFGLRSFDHLRHLFRYLAEHSASIANLSALSVRVGVPASTVADMLLRLQQTLLVQTTQPFARGKQMLRPRPKVYLCDASLRAAVALCGPEMFSDAAAHGSACETAAHRHLAEWARGEGGDLSYWRDARGEVDFVLRLRGRPPLPIEVTSAQPSRAKLAHLARCARDVGARHALLLAESGEIAGPMHGDLVCWPLPAFLWTLASHRRARAREEDRG